MGQCRFPPRQRHCLTPRPPSGPAPEEEVEAVVGDARIELALLERRVERLRTASSAVPPDPEWAQIMARAVTHLARKFHEPAGDPAGFGSVTSALGVRVRALEYSSRTRLEVTATVTRAALLDLLGDLGDVARRIPARQSLTLAAA